MREYYIFVTESGVRDGFLYEHATVVDQVGDVFIVAVAAARNPEDPEFLARYQRDRLLSGYRAAACGDIARDIDEARGIAAAL